MRLFKVTQDSVEPVAQQKFSDEHYESHLEEWIRKNPRLIADDILILGKQVLTDVGTKIDLLALDREGNAVIIELKRGEATRELVGQINEYLTTVEGWDERELERRTKRAPRTLAKEFRERFNCDPPGDFNTQPRAVVVVESMDETTVKTLNRQGIGVLEFSYLGNADDEYLLVNDLRESRHARGKKSIESDGRQQSKGEAPRPAEGDRKDKTKYRFEGTSYPKGRLVPAVVAAYLRKEPNTDFVSLKRVFPDDLLPSYGVFERADKAQGRAEKDGRPRYFIRDRELLRTGDGISIAVCSQWGKPNIGPFLARARKLGFDIEEER